MNNNDNNISRRRKKNKEKKDFSLVDNKVPKEQKITTTTIEAGVMDLSAGIIDIDNTPDVAAWNKEIHIKGDGAGTITVNNRLHETKTTSPLPPTTVSIHLIQKKGSKKDLIIDPADKKQVDEAIKSGSTLTDEADLS